MQPFTPIAECCPEIPESGVRSFDELVRVWTPNGATDHSTAFLPLLPPPASAQCATCSSLPPVAAPASAVLEQPPVVVEAHVTSVILSVQPGETGHLPQINRRPSCARQSC